MFDAETVDPETSTFQHTTFGLVDEDDVAYFGKLYTPKSNIDFPQLTSALVPIPDEDIYPEWMPRNAKLTQTQETFSSDRFTKRPDLPLYDIFQDHNVLRLIQNELMEEIKQWRRWSNIHIPTSSSTTVAGFVAAGSRASSSTGTLTHSPAT